MSINNRPEWHEPVSTVTVDTDDPIEDTIEVGEVALVDGPIDPVPLSASSHSRDDNFPRRSAGPMPDLTATSKETTNTVADKVTDTVQDLKGKAQDAAQKVADTATGAKAAAGDALDTAKTAGASATGALSGAAGKISAAGTTGVQNAGTAIWTLIQRNPLQALCVIASLIWLLRNNQAAAALPPVSISDAASDAAGKVGTVAGQVQVAAGNLKTQVQDQAKHGAGWFSQTLQANPLAIGAMAIVFGAGLGFAVPETPYEDKLLGKTRDDLAGKAQEAAQDLGHKVQTVAQTAVQGAIETVKEEAKNQGLTA